jgi:hypothetical protein
MSVVFHESITGWRQLSYYEPDVSILIFRSQSDGTVMTRQVRGNQAETRTSPQGVAVRLRACEAVVWVDVVDRPKPQGPATIQAVNSRVFLTTSAPGRSFDFRGVRFVTDPSACRD